MFVCRLSQSAIPNRRLCDNPRNPVLPVRDCEKLRSQATESRLNSSGAVRLAHVLRTAMGQEVP